MKYTPPKSVRLITPIPPVQNIDREENGRAMFVLLYDWSVVIDGNLWTIKAKSCGHHDIYTDFGSYPCPLWTVFNPLDIYHQAGTFFHDEMYRAHAPRPWSDDCFRLLLEARGIWKIKSNIEWAGVRVGGQGPYNRNSAELVAHTRRHLCFNSQPISETGWPV